MEEIWKDLVCQDIRIGWYEVSNLGKVRYKNTKRLMSPFDSRGYMRVGLMTDTRGQQKFPVHRLVASAFVPGFTEERHFVNHIDGNKRNNIAQNLEWVTASENTRHAIRTGLLQIVKGEDNGGTNLTNDQARRMLQVLKDSRGCVRGTKMILADEGINVTSGIISHVKEGSTWNFISKEYFDTDYFKTHQVTTMIIREICKTLAWNDGDISDCYDHMKSIDAEISRELIGLIKDKRLWKRISDRYFLKEEFDPNSNIYHTMYSIKDGYSGYVYITPRITAAAQYIRYYSDLNYDIIYDKLFNMEETIRRFHITYIKPSSMSRMNDAKYNEVLDRVKHG